MIRNQLWVVIAGMGLMAAAGQPVVIGDEASTPFAPGPLTLWYRQPAERWTEALPVGNGRLGAMIFGRTGDELIQFNEATVWTGQPHEYQHPGASKALPELRKLLFEGKQAEAEALAMKEFMSEPLRQKAYQPFGNIKIAFPEREGKIENYTRWLDLDSATAGVRYEQAGVTFERETFSSDPDQVLVVRLASQPQGKLNVAIALDSPHASARSRVESGDVIVLSGQVEDQGVRFEARLKLRIEGGSVAVRGDSIEVREADAATLLLVAATSVKNYRDNTVDPAERAIHALQAVGEKPFERLRADHVADHRRLFRRVALDLGSGAESVHGRPTDERLRTVARNDDPSLAALYFQYGRYLLIASSRPGGQPANLQGIWNDQMKPSWDSKWTVNINTEMNYWPAEVTNLSECQEPLYDMIDEVAASGKKTAEAHYAARGWVLHHNTDLWRGTAPINKSNHGIWPTGGAWLCHHLWDHYLFTGDRASSNDVRIP